MLHNLFARLTGARGVLAPSPARSAARRRGGDPVYRAAAAAVEGLEERLLFATYLVSVDPFRQGVADDYDNGSIVQVMGGTPATLTNVRVSGAGVTSAESALRAALFQQGV